MKIFTFRTIARGIVIWIRIIFIFHNIGFIIRFSGDIFWHSFHDYLFLRSRGNICINWCFAGLFFRWYFSKCWLKYWFLWNAMVTMDQAILCFNVFNFRRALPIEWNDFPDSFSIDTDWNSLSVGCPEMASSNNVFSVRSFSRFIDEVWCSKGLAWLNIVRIISGLRLNLHTPSSNSAYKWKNTKICKMVLSRNVQFFKDNPNPC